MRFRMIAVAALSLMVVTGHAQPVWNFEQVMQAALATHPLIQGKRSAQAAAKADQDGAEWQRYPSVSLEANTPSSTVSSGSLLRIEQPLWSGGRITANINAAGSRFDAASAAVNEVRLDLALKVIAATTEALRQQARQQHSATGLKEHEKLLAMIERRVAQEVSPMADQRLAASRLYTTANELSSAHQALNNALVQLSQLTSRPVTAMDDKGLSEAGAPTSLEMALTQALAQSPLLKRLAFEEQTAQSDIDTKRAAYMPQLVLRLESSNAGSTTDQRAMLVLLAQPGAGLSAKSSVDASVARREATRLVREAAERDVRERITVDWNEWQAARMRLENANAARAMSTEVFDSYARQYTTGRKTWIDVLNAVREAMQSELSADDAQSQLLAASLRLRAQTGTLTGLNQP